MLRHEHIADLVTAIEARLTSLCPSLKAISRSQATSLKDIAELVPACHKLPAAIVLLGPVDGPQDQTSRGCRQRVVDIGILLVGEYSAAEDEGAPTHWGILDEVHDAFMPASGRGELVGLPVAVLGAQDGANRGTLLIPAGYRPLQGLQGRCAGVYNLLALDTVAERSGTPVEPAEPAAPETGLTSLNATDRFTVWLTSGSTFLRRYVSWSTLQSLIGTGGGTGVSWPTADGSALADADRFAVGQLADGTWTWVAKTGTQIKAWLKTWADGLYAGLVHGSRHKTGGADALSAADIGAQPALTPASQAEMEAGTEAGLRSMSPVRVAQAIAALGAEGSGKLLQQVAHFDGTPYDVTAEILVDDSVPQSSEGVAYTELDTTITPQSATSVLDIEVVLFVGSKATTTSRMVAALFVDAGANAVAATATFATQAMYTQLVLRYQVAAGSTAARTYKLRIASAASSTVFYVNRTASVASNLFGGIVRSSMVVREVAA